MCINIYADLKLFYVSVQAFRQAGTSMGQGHGCVEFLPFVSASAKSS